LFVVKTYNLLVVCHEEFKGWVCFQEHGGDGSSTYGVCFVDSSIGKFYVWKTDIVFDYLPFGLKIKYKLHAEQLKESINESLTS